MAKISIMTIDHEVNSSVSVTMLNFFRPSIMAMGHIPGYHGPGQCIIPPLIPYFLIIEPQNTANNGIGVESVVSVRFKLLFFHMKLRTN